jgi:hypothetical protein
MTKGRLVLSLVADSHTEARLSGDLPADLCRAAQVCLPTRTRRETSPR